MSALAGAVMNAGQLLLLPEWRGQQLLVQLLYSFCAAYDARGAVADHDLNVLSRAAAA